MSSYRIGLISLSLLFASILAAAQTPNAPPAAVGNAIEANANLVLVDVVAASHGNAVRGLNRAQFHIYEDGKEVTISSFDEHQSAANSALVPKTIDLPPHTFSNAPTYPDTGVVNVLLLDGLNTPVQNQMELHRQMLEYMEKIPPGTPMAIFTLSSRLRLIQGFTADPAQLVIALKSNDSKTQSSVDNNSNAADAEDDAASIPIPANTSGATLLAQAIAGMQQFTADVAAYQMDIRVQLTLGAIQQLARYLSAIPGRKNLIWFSGSFPIALDPDDELNSPFSVMRNYSEDVRATSQLLSSARVAVYPVDARGLMSLPSFDASIRSPGAQGKASKSIKKDSSFLQNTSSEHDTMAKIAEQTGGKSYVNTNGLKETVASIIENGSRYYTIGYVPTNNQFDGQYRKIRVQLDNSDAKLDYRRGYYSDHSVNSAEETPGSKIETANSSVKTSMQAAAQMGAPQTTQILLEARVLPASDPMMQGPTLPKGPAGAMTASLKGPVSRYVVDLKVDARNLGFATNADGSYKNSIECVAIAYNSEGKQINYVDIGMQLNLKPEQFTYVMKNGLPVRFAIDLPQGKIALRMLVYEITSGHIGSLEVPMHVASGVLRPGS